MYKYPFTLVTGQGLGTSYTSLTQYGAINPHTTFGAAKLLSTVNVGTGNLVLEDHLFRAVERNEQVTLGFIYNSQSAKNPWQLKIKSLKNLPPVPPKKAGATIILLEADGHETVYTAVSNELTYMAPVFGNGQASITYDETEKIWIWVDPVTGHQEHYNLAGRLIRKVDERGRETIYTYAEGRLKQIYSPDSETKYLLVYDDTLHTITIQSQVSTLPIQTEQKHTFDAKGRLLKTEIGTKNPYIIDYSYYEGTTQLIGVSQSDGTHYIFGYDHYSNLATARLTDLRYNGSAVEFNYISATETDILVQGIRKFTIEIDAAKRLAKVKQPSGRTAIEETEETTSFTYYADSGQLRMVEHPNDSATAYVYGIDALKTVETTLPENKTTQLVYSQDDMPAGMLIQRGEQYLDPDTKDLITLVTRYIYDDDYDQLGKRHYVLRFELSPLGKVKEYRYDKRGDRVSVRAYKSACFDLTNKPHVYMPSLEDMETWAGEQPISDITLRTLSYNNRGLIATRQDFAHVDASGVGIFDDQAGLLTRTWDIYGNCRTESNVLQDRALSKEIRQEFQDSLHRITKKIEASISPKYEREKTYEYKDSEQQVALTQYNDRADLLTKDLDGFLVEREEGGRRTTYQRDQLGLLIQVTPTDGQPYYQTYDLAQRLIFKINALGYVQETRYDHTNRYYINIQYDNPIDLAEFIHKYGILPTTDVVLSLLKDNPEKDRYQFTFNNENGRPRFLVDAENALTEYCYDPLGRQSGVIRYVAPVTAEEMALLKAGKPLTRVPNPIEDRCTKTVWNEDSEKIATQDAGGYVTTYDYNAAAQRIKTISYNTPAGFTQAALLAFLENPITSDKDVTTYDYWDARNIKRATIDGERYMTTTSENNAGGLFEKVAYAQPVIPTPVIPKPALNAEDQTEIHHVDGMNRPSTVIGAFGLQTQNEYDRMDNMTAKLCHDLAEPNRPDRSVNVRFNAWNEVEAQCNPRISEKLKQAIDKEKIWQEDATQHTRDPNSGLLLSERNSLDQKIVYYYDAEKQPRYRIDARGSVTEIQYNSAGEIVLKRAYVTALTEAQRATLEGGFLTETIETLFEDLENEADAITACQRNRRGQVTCVIDPEGYRTETDYNAFGEPVKIRRCVGTKTPTLEMSYEYNTRGHETKKTITAPGVEPIVEARLYKTLHGKITQYTNPIGGVSYFFYDKRARLVKTIDALGAVSETIYDAFDRPLIETLASGAIIKHEYDQKTRSHTVKKYDTDKQTLLEQSTVLANAFTEPSVTMGAYEEATQWEYGPDGQTENITKPVEGTSKETYDLQGNHLTHMAPNGDINSYEYDEANNQCQRIVGVGTLDAKTQWLHDALNRPSQKIDPNQVSQKTEYDRRGLPKKVTRDTAAGGLNLTTLAQYDGQKNKTEEQHGQGEQIALTKNYAFDGAGRASGNTVDPNGIHIQTVFSLNALGLPIYEVDPNGNVTWHFYDTKGQACVSVDVIGVVTENHYNLLGKNIQRRIYKTPLDLASDPITPETTLAEIKARIANKSLPIDQVTYQFFDGIGRLSFRANNVGSVIGFVYDLNGRQHQKTAYANPVDPAQLATMTTAELAALMAEQPSVDDRIDYKMWDAAGREAYVIDARGAITKKTYDARGRMILETRYATLLSDPASVAALPTDQVAQHIKLAPETDRTTYYVFDANNKPIFSVDPEGGVLRFDHDPNGNVLRNIEFSKKITAPASYEALCDLLKTLEPDPSQGDRIVTYKYDTANRKVTAIDALGFKDTYEYDALSNVVKHVDRALSVWKTGYDTANRLTSKTAPAVDISLVTRDPNDPKKLQLAEEKQQVTVAQFTLDKLSNQTQITFAKGTTEERNTYFSFTPHKKPKKTTLKNIPIDDPEKVAAYETFPVVYQDITTDMVYDTCDNVLVEEGADNHVTFYVYDAANQKRFEVQANGAVIEWQYNAFGKEPTREIHYANRLSISLTPYLKTGLTQALILEHLVKDSQKDRTTTKKYNRLGSIESEKGETDYYYISALGLNESEYLLGTPETRYYYNAFDDQTCESFLRDEKNQHWSSEWTWLDRNGNPIATVDANNGLTCILRNAFGEEIERTEYASPLKMTITQKTTLTDILVAVVESADDRCNSTDYDLRGDYITTTKKQIVTQSIIKGEAGPVMKDQPPENLSKHHAYGPRQEQISFTDENGHSQYRYVDKRGNLVAVTGITRTSEDNMGNPITLTPLTVYGHNHFGQPVKTTHYESGTTPADPERLPEPIVVNPLKDQTTLSLMDVRGVLVAKQNAEGNTKVFTVTSASKPAREFHQLTNNDAAHIDEVRYTQDIVDNPIRQEYRRDNQVQTELTTESQFNTFNEAVAQGPGDGTWPLQKNFDNNGNVWLTNEKNGAPTLRLTDLSGAVVGRIQSATKDLSSVSQADVPGILVSPIEDAERFDLIRDLKGQVTEQAMPAYETMEKNKPLNMPLDMITGAVYPSFGTYSITWKHVLSTTLLAPQLMLTPINNPGHNIELEVKDAVDQFGVHRSGVDISMSDLPSDIYFYRIDFLTTDPMTGTLNSEPIFRAEGQLQFYNTYISESEHLLAITQADTESTVLLTGKTAGLTAVQPMQLGKPIGPEIPVSLNAKHEALVDLSTLPSGEYQFQPMYGVSSGTLTLPFIIFTMTETSEQQPPLGRVITSEAASITLDTDAKNATFYYTPPPSLKTTDIFLDIFYQDTDGADKMFSVWKAPRNNPDNPFGVELTFLLPSDFDKLVQVDFSIEVNSFKVPLFSQTPEVLSNPDQYAFSDKTILLLSGIEDVQDGDSFLFLITSGDPNAGWKKRSIQLIHPSQGKTTDVLIDLGPLVPGTYPYQIASHKDLTFTYFKGSNVFAGTPIPPPKMKQERPHQYAKLDRWGNIIEETDTLGFSTHHKLGARNLKIQTIQPMVMIVTEEGKPEDFIPVTRMGYDRTGRLIGTQKPKGNVEAIWRDEAGQEIAHELGNGVISEQLVFNALLQECVHIDSRGERWRNEFNRMNKIVTVTWPSGNKVTYTYNENNQRRSETDQMGEGHKITFDIDLRNNVIKTTLPTGEVTTSTFDRNRLVLAHENIDGKLSRTYDYWGNILHKIDLGEAHYDYDYDFKKQLIEQISTNSGHGSYVDFYQFFSDVPQYYKILDPFFYIPTKQHNNLGQLLTYQYQVGRVIRFVDHATGKVVDYDYDSENQITYKSITYQGHPIQEMQMVYDALERVIWMSNGQAYFVMPCDENGNKRAVYSYFGRATMLSSSAWNAYNFADQIIRERGTLEDGVISGGDEFGYDGTTFRMTHTKNGEVNTLTYNADGLLTERIRPTEDGGATLLGKRVYQKNSLPTQVNKYDSPASTVENWFNASDRTIRTLQHADGQRTDSYYRKFTAEGQSQKQIISYGNVEDDLQADYDRFDELRLRELGGTRIVDGRSGPYSSVQKHWDANGFLQSVIGAAINGNPTDTQNTYVVTDEEGRTLLKFSVVSQLLSEPFHQLPIFFGDIAHVTRYFYELDGTLLGSVKQTFSNWLRGDTVHASFHSTIDAPPLVDGSYPPPYPEHYTVVTGDTFETISQKTKDSPYFAATIAQANGRSLSDTPAPGSSLTIPQGIQTHNNTRTHQNYSRATRSIIGPIYPRLSLPPPPKPHHSFWADLFEAVVGIVVTILFPPASGMLAVLEAIAEGILIDAADQGIELAFGERKKFSFEELGSSGLEGGIGAGAQAYFPHVNLAEELLLQGTVAVSEQYLEIALHLRKHFDLRRALYQTVTSTLSYELHMKEGSNAEKFEKAAINDVYSAELKSLVYQQPIDLTNLAAQLVADTIFAVIQSHRAKQRSMTQRANHHYAKAQRAANDPNGFSKSQKGYRPAKHRNGSQNRSEQVRTTSDDWTRRGESALDDPVYTQAGYPPPEQNEGIGITYKQWQTYLLRREDLLAQGNRLMEQQVQASQAVQPAPTPYRGFAETLYNNRHTWWGSASIEATSDLNTALGYVEEGLDWTARSLLYYFSGDKGLYYHDTLITSNNFSNRLNAGLSALTSDVENLAVGEMAGNVVGDIASYAPQVKKTLISLGQNTASLFGWGGAEGLSIPETTMEIPRNPISANNIGSSELASFSNKVYKDVKPGVYFQAQRFGQKGMGQFFTPVKPLDSMDAEEMLNIKAWGNNADQIAIVKIKPGLMAWQGGIKGGAGEQLFIPHELHSDFINTLDVEPLYVEELKWLTRP